MGVKMKRKAYNARNASTNILYINRLLDLCLSVFKWHNLPDNIDPRYIELCLARYGMAVFFKDDVMEKFLCLACMQNGPFDVYNTPINRIAYAANGYQNHLNNGNSVIIYNNYTRTNMVNTIENYAESLSICDRVIDINVNRQKTPNIIATTEQQLLSLKNLFSQVDENAPIIFADKNSGLLDALHNVDITAPFIADKVFQLKRKIWGEAMNFIGLTANTEEKAEKLVTQEVDNYNQNTYAQRFTRLASREDACERINKMFNTNIKVTFRKEIELAGVNPIEKAQIYYKGGVEVEQIHD